MIGRESWSKVSSRVAAGACVTLIGFLSLMPAEKVTRTSLGGHIEHVLAYFVAAWIASMAFSQRGIILITSSLCAYAGCLEYLQRFSPGRNSSFEDFVFSASGVVLSVGTYALLKRRPRGTP